MKITHVPVKPTERALSESPPALTPELLAAFGARYSRSGEGLDSIYKITDLDNSDRAVDAIFKFVDYGHASIADMVPIAMFMDQISILAAYLIFKECSVASGQETSSRYVKFDQVLSPDELGVSAALATLWDDKISTAFKSYETALELWEEVRKRDPSVTRIPAEMRASTKVKDQKAVERMERNFAFDRARYFLPTTAITNMMLVQSGREWARLARVLRSSINMPELQAIGEGISEQLEIVSPRLVRHATFDEATRAIWEANPNLSEGPEDPTEWETSGFHSAKPKTWLRIYNGGIEADMLESLRYRTTRYSPFGSPATMTLVKYSCDAITMGEIRDLNRHRTGSKNVDYSPVGFYCGADCLPETPEFDDCRKKLQELDEANSGVIEDPNLTYPNLYGTLLGHQYPFAHVTTADKFIYTSELRTGTGAHYRYAQHFHDWLARWFERYPSTEEFIHEGRAEPE